ncbi:MAG TPA: hypothetical protein PKA64_10940, partial [Myxococcota bacterium]|nr:hypothetical protein [Myxococcota bacterium]
RPDRYDTDGDGYGDGDELERGSDPRDPASGIYRGGWPYNPSRDAPRGDPGDHAEIGRPFLRAALVDQHGDAVDLYDFADDGAPVVIQVAGMWCAPCIQLGELLSGRPSELDAYVGAAEAVREGRVWWLTVLAQDEDGAPADADDAARWAARFDVPQVPVLVDDGTVWPYASPGGALPSVWRLDAGFVVQDGGAEDARVLAFVDTL